MSPFGSVRNRIAQGALPFAGPGGLPWVVKAGMLVIAHYLAIKLSGYFVIGSGDISPLWPPSAIALCACLWWGPSMALVIWLNVLLANLVDGMSFMPALAIGLGSALEAFMAAALIRRFTGTPPDFADPPSVFKFAGIALISAMPAAIMGISVLNLSSSGIENATLMWLTWWLGDAVGMVVLAPPLLAWNSRVESQRRSRVEAFAFLVLLLATCYVVFADAFGRLSLTVLAIPFIIWAAFRFSMRSAILTTSLVCAVAAWSAANGYGPFATDNFTSSLLLALTYTGIVGVMGMILASLVNRQRVSEAKLKQERGLLEKRVQNRTDALLKDIEKRKRIEYALAAREKQLAEAQHLARIGSWNWDLASNTITWSDELYRIYAVRKSEFVPTTDNCIALIHPDDLEMLRRLVAYSRGTGRPFHAEHRIMTPSGDIKFVAANGFVQKGSGGKAVRMFGTTQDITEAKRSELALREAEQRYRLLVELCPDAILVQQNDKLIFVNHAAVELLGATSAGQLLARPVGEVFHPDFQDLVRKRMHLLRQGQALPAIDETLARVDGTRVDVDIHVSAFMYKGAAALLLIARDITERKKSAEQLAYLAHYDSLTGLPNRALFHQRLAHALELAQRAGKSLEILFLDLDRFKYINDTLGHAVGDLVLREAAGRLQDLLRESDTVARLGGDEFVVLVEDVDAPDRGRIIAEKILAALRPPFMKEREPLNVTVSIGISNYPADGTDAETLLKKADIAMYRAKESGRNAYHYYSDEMNIHSADRLAMEYALSHAIHAQQLSLLYQPKIDVATGRISGMEALLRWCHPTLGWVPPHEFIALAEETGLINAIGKWALRTACAQNKRWQENSAERMKVAVNLSPRQLSDQNLIEDIRDILQETGLDASCLELEITENAVMANPDKAMILLRTLRDMGVSVTIDDFGIGYSSLAYLQRFPIHAVKIDRSFIQGVPESRGDAAITKAIISLAHSLECKVVAEGAETQMQFEFLREHDCDSVQGYYFSEPMSAQSFGRLLTAQAQLHAPMPAQLH